MKVKEFISIVDCSYITICYAGFGERIYKGPLTGNIPTHALEYYVTYILPGNDKVYIEVHENAYFSIPKEDENAILN